MHRATIDLAGLAQKKITLNYVTETFNLCTILVQIIFPLNNNLSINIKSPLQTRFQRMPIYPNNLLDVGIKGIGLFLLEFLLFSFRFFHLDREGPYLSE